MAKKTQTKNTKQTKEKKITKSETKKTKKTKDPNAPKHACSAYIIFSQERRASLVKEQPSLNNKEVISALSKEWNALSDTKKAPYAKKAEAEKARYKKEMEAYSKKAN